MTRPPHSHLHTLHSHPCSVTQTWILLLSVCLLLGLFYSLSLVDRTTLHIVHGFTDPLIDQVGDSGNALGKGITLVIISLLIGAVGLWRSDTRWTSAGFYSLLAHGISGLLVQIVKHSLGRPRPRLMDSTPWEIGPSFESGLDSFPSGHTSASFSVATVLAFYFPAGRVLWFGLAGFVSISRVIKGSHFPTDVLAGIILGIGSGLLLMYTKDQWKSITTRTCAQGLPWLVLAFGLLWVAVPHPGIELEPTISVTAGCLLVLAGWGVSLYRTGNSGFHPHPSGTRQISKPSGILLGMGVACSTGSVIVIAAGTIAGIIWWLNTTSPDERTAPPAFLAGLHPRWIAALMSMAGLALIGFVVFLRSG